MAQHAEHQRDEKKGGERDPGIGRAVHHIEHREHGSEQLPFGQARIGEVQIEVESEDDKKGKNQRRHDDAGLEQRLAVDLALRVESGQHDQIQQ